MFDGFFCSMSATCDGAVLLWQWLCYVLFRPHIPAINAVRLSSDFEAALFLEEEYELISYEGGDLFFMPIVNNSVLFTSYFCIFLLIVKFVFSHSSTPIYL